MEGLTRVGDQPVVGGSSDLNRLDIKGMMENGIAQKLRRVRDQQSVGKRLHPPWRSGHVAVSEGEAQHREHDQIHAQEVDEIAQYGQRPVTGQYDDEIAGNRHDKRANQLRDRRGHGSFRFSAQAGANRQSDDQQRDDRAHTVSHPHTSISPS